MSTQEPLSFFARFWMAFVCFWEILFRPAFARALLPTYRERKQLPPRTEVSPQPAAAALSEPAPQAPEKTPERVHASALWMLAALQREGRLIDFLQEDVTSFTDSEVGAAARVVHGGCRKVLTEYFLVEPVLSEPEGAQVTVPSGFDAERIRLTGKVAGQPPFAGALKHHGWVTRQVRFPTFSEKIDPRVLAPAEVELT
jgi:hypothetical protein